MATPYLRKHLSEILLREENESLNQCYSELYKTEPKFIINLYSIFHSFHTLFIKWKQTRIILHILV